MSIPIEELQEVRELLDCLDEATRNNVKECVNKLMSIIKEYGCNGLVALGIVGFTVEFVTDRIEGEH